MKFAAAILLLLLMDTLAADQIRIDARAGTTGNYAPVTLTTTPDHVLTFDAGGVPIIGPPPASGIAAGDSPTWTGAHTFTRAGAASAPTISLTGLPFTGGTATTTKPLMLIEPAGTTSTGWSTAGTAVGVNAASGFAGNLIDAQVAGVSKFGLDSTGVITTAAPLNAPILVHSTGQRPAFTFTSNGVGFMRGATILSTFVYGASVGGPSGLNLGGQYLGWDGGEGISEMDLSISRLGAANLRQGKPASATPLAQTFTIGEASRPGTDSNVAGASGTIQSGLGTGTGTGSSLIFQTPTVAGAGSATQTYTTRLTLNASGALVADDAYAAGWDGSLAVPTKNAVYDKIQTLASGSGTSVPHGSMGATETFDVTASAHHTGTLDTNCTATFSNWPASGTVGRVDLVLTQDVTGGRTWTNPGAVVTSPAPTVNPAANSVTHLTYESSDAGATIYGWSDYGEVGQITFTVDGGGSVIATGTQKSKLLIPYACRITGVTVLSDVASTTTVDIWSEAYSGYPPAIGNSIVASAKPTLSGTTFSRSTTLTGWRTAIVADEVMYFTVDTNSAATHLDIILSTAR